MAEDRLAGWTDGQTFLQLLAARHRDPGHLGRKAFDVLGFALQETLRHKQRKVRVLVAGRLEAPIETGLHVFPEAEAVWANDHRAANRLEIVRQLRTADGRDIPARERLAVAGVLGR